MGQWGWTRCVRKQKQIDPKKKAPSCYRNMLRMPNKMKKTLQSVGYPSCAHLQMPGFCSVGPFDHPALFRVEEPAPKKL